MRYFSIILLLALLATAARAQLTTTGIGKVANGGVVPPVGCTGTIDGSEGCPLPMLGL